MAVIIRWLTLVCMFACVSSLHAHDLGVARAELVELADQHYRLRVQVNQTQQDLFSSPNIPQPCQYVTPPRGRKSSGAIDYEFICSRPLLADDQIDLPWQREGVMLSSHWLDSRSSRRFFARDSSSIPVSMAELNAGSGSLWMTAKRYLSLGVEHILLGYDHLLFVLCLLLLVDGLWRLIETITAFTVAHSLTLGLATLGFLHVPVPAVEACIALSIAFLAAEVIRCRLHGRATLSLQYPGLVSFIFGLLHGLGFASALSELGLPEQEITSALLFFNLGVEAGQLLFILCIILTAQVARTVIRRPIPHFVPALASGIGILSSYWFLERASAIMQ